MRNVCEHTYMKTIHIFASIFQCLIVLFSLCEQGENTNQGRVRKETYFFYIN